MDWREALAVNNGDYAYAPDGGMLSHEDDGSYTLRNGNLAAACEGNFADVERTGLTLEDVPTALMELGMQADEWDFE